MMYPVGWLVPRFFHIIHNKIHLTRPFVARECDGTGPVGRSLLTPFLPRSTPWVRHSPHVSPPIPFQHPSRLGTWGTGEAPAVGRLTRETRGRGWRGGIRPRVPRKWGECWPSFMSYPASLRRVHGPRFLRSLRTVKRSPLRASLPPTACSEWE